jgi:5-carboxymethyl-2-hydroxymuconate isomerase
MPQISIEYSPTIAATFDARRFASEVHTLLVAIVETELASCKTRLVELGDVVIGDGSDANAMIHVDVRILSGRTPAQKRQLGEAVMAALAAAVAKPEGLDLQFTVEVRDLDRDNYHKQRLR